MVIVHGLSPLRYPHQEAKEVRRATLVDPEIPPPHPSELYFAEGARGTVNGRKATVPAALPHAAAFVDYSWHDKHVFVHFVTVRSDLRKKGYGALLVDDFLRGVEREGATSVDFGAILHDAMEKIFKHWRKLSNEGAYRPRVYGKIW